MNLNWIKTKHQIDIQTPLNTYAVFSGNKIEKVIIGLHGYGDNGENSAHIAQAFDMENTLFLFLEGPLKVPMSFGGYHWFDLFHEPHKHLEESSKKILDLYHHLVNDHKFTAQKIYFLGFSQGAALALYCGLKTKQKIGGIVSFSGFLVHSAELLREQDSLNKDCPIYLMHGDEDQTIFPILFFEAMDLLKYMNFTNVQTKLYNLGHTISYEQIAEIKKFLSHSREPCHSREGGNPEDPDLHNSTK